MGLFGNIVKSIGGNNNDDVKSVVRKKALQMPNNIADSVILKGKGSAVKNKSLIMASKGDILLSRKTLSYNSMLNKNSNFTLYLADITSMKKENSTFGECLKIIDAKDNNYTILIDKHNTLWAHYITVLAGLDGSLLNITLIDGEKLVGISNVSFKESSSILSSEGTFYLTNQRLIINKCSAKGSEGNVQVFDKQRDEIVDVYEERSLTNCTYTIRFNGSYMNEYEIKFEGVTPRWFLQLIPNAQGNADILNRNKKAKNVLKGIGIVAAIAGAGAGIDDLLDGNDDLVDIDGDGIDDTMFADTDGDGVYDTAYMDTDGDGTFDSMAVDTDGDGTLDTIGVDTDGDGEIDTIAMDTDGDGAIDTMAVDSDGNGTIDSIAMDSNGDGMMDTIASDRNGDGVMDTIATDRNGDGRMDTIAMDTNGDGRMDTIGLDVNGDGSIDVAGVDIDGDGSVDVMV